MRDQHILDIAEAYASVYAKPEQEVLSEEVEQLDEISRSMGRRATQYRKDQEQSAHMERVRQHQEKMKNDPEYRANHERLSRVHSKKEEQKESFDLFDYLLEYLVAEGYADTNKAALAIMANMSEEWRQNIVETIAGARYTPNPIGNAIRDGAGVLKGVMNNPSVQGVIRSGSQMLQKRPVPTGYSTREGDGKPREIPLWGPGSSDSTSSPTRPKPQVKKEPPMRDEPLW